MGYAMSPTGYVSPANWRTAAPPPHRVRSSAVRCRTPALEHPTNVIKVVGLGCGMMDMTWISTILVGAGCLAFGYIFGTRYPGHLFVKAKTSRDTSVINRNKWTQAKPLLEVEKLAEILEDFKMVLVVRNDLKMGKGKIAAQCSHATLGLYKKILHRAPKALNRWEMCGQVKVVVKIESEDDMMVLQERAKSLNIPTHIVIDAGRTQIAPNSRTVMAVLGPAELVDDVTGGLKLL